jgi:hypothetical protein
VTHSPPELLEDMRFMEAKALLRLLGKSESVTLSREQVVDLVVLLSMSVRGRRGRRVSADAVRRDIAIATRFSELAAERGCAAAADGRETRHDLADEFHVDERTVRRAIRAYAAITRPEDLGNK